MILLFFKEKNFIHVNISKLILRIVCVEKSCLLSNGRIL